MAAADRQLRDFRRARRIVLRAQRVEADGSLCYRCRRKREHLYPLQLPGFMFAYEGESTGAPTNILICADCLRSACALLSTWVLNP